MKGRALEQESWSRFLDNAIASKPEPMEPLVYIFGVIGILLVIALFTAKANRTANRLLTALIACVLLLQWPDSLATLGPSDFPYLFRARLPLNLLAPPLLYLYVVALTTPGFHLQPKHLVHLWAFVLGLAWYFAGGWPSHLGHDEYFRSACLTVVIGIYLWLSYVALGKFLAAAANYFSDLSKVRLTWLRLLLGLSLSLWLVSALDVVTGPSIRIWPFRPFARTVMIFVLAAFSLRQAPVFREDEESSPESENNPAEAVRQQRLTDADLERYRQKLLQYMETERPYLRPELRLPELSHAVALKPYLLSEVLNRGLGMNFFEFINRYRIDTVKERLGNPKYTHMNILGIAMESGFNSKSVFNETFRQFTGMTPSAFRSQAELKGST